MRHDGGLLTPHADDAAVPMPRTLAANASTTKPAKFVVVMVKKKGVDAVLPAE